MDGLLQRNQIILHKYVDILLLLVAKPEIKYGGKFERVRDSNSEAFL